MKCYVLARQYSVVGTEKWIVIANGKVEHAKEIEKAFCEKETLKYEFKVMVEEKNKNATGGKYFVLCTLKAAGNTSTLWDHDEYTTWEGTYEEAGVIIEKIRASILDSLFLPECKIIKDCN